VRIAMIMRRLEDIYEVIAHFRTGWMRKQRTMIFRKK
jgi:hypothetical protein